MSETNGNAGPFRDEATDPDPEAAFRRSTRRVAPGVLAGDDGVLRWIYEMNMWKNPTLVVTIWKVLLLCAMAPAVLILLLGIIEGSGIASAFFAFLKVGGLVAAVVTGLMLLAYPLVAWMNGGKYCVIFEMDEDGVNHIQMARQFDRSRALSAITVLAGIAAGNPGTAGAGLLAGSRKNLYSDFRKVRKVRVNEGRSVIYLDERLSRNQVYAEPADFPFVRDHILRRVPGAEVKYSGSEPSGGGGG